MFSPDYYRMQFPNSAVVLREATDPAEYDIAIESGTRETSVEDACDIFVSPRDGGPTTRFAKVLDEQRGRLLPDLLRLAGKVNDAHSDL